MSTVQNIGVVTNGLVLYLDAANTKSYVSGSTSWNDLSRNGLSGTLTNGPTFNSANGGSIVFDESLSQYSITDNILQFTPTQSFTLNVIFYLTSISGDNSTIRNTTIFGRGATAGSVGIGAQKSTTNVYTLSIGSRAVNNFTTSIPLTLNQIYFVSFVYDGAAELSTTTNQYIYINGLLTNTVDVTVGLSGSFDTAGYASFINRAVPGGTGAFSSGRIFQASIYNRTLSAQEVLQNYNATKSRFGLV